MTQAHEAILIKPASTSCADVSAREASRWLECDRVESLFADAIDALNEELAIVDIQIETQRLSGGAGHRGPRVYELRCRGPGAPKRRHEATLVIGPDELRILLDDGSSPALRPSSLVQIEPDILCELLILVVETLTQRERH